jgi:hypothetical protein
VGMGGGGGGQRTHPTETTRRRVKVAREGCREERVTKDPNSAKSGGVESVSTKEAWKVWYYVLAVHVSNCVLPSPKFWDSV